MDLQNYIVNFQLYTREKKKKHSYNKADVTGMNLWVQETARAYIFIFLLKSLSSLLTLCFGSGYIGRIKFLILARIQYGVIASTINYIQD